MLDPCLMSYRCGLLNGLWEVQAWSGLRAFTFAVSSTGMSLVQVDAWLLLSLPVGLCLNITFSLKHLLCILFNMANYTHSSYAPNLCPSFYLVLPRNTYNYMTYYVLYSFLFIVCLPILERDYESNNVSFFHWWIFSLDVFILIIPSKCSLMFSFY